MRNFESYIAMKSEKFQVEIGRLGTGEGWWVQL